VTDTQLVVQTKKVWEHTQK